MVRNSRKADQRAVESVVFLVNTGMLHASCNISCYFWVMLLLARSFMAVINTSTREGEMFPSNVTSGMRKQLLTMDERETEETKMNLNVMLV